MITEGTAATRVCGAAVFVNMAWRGVVIKAVKGLTLDAVGIGVAEKVP